MNQTTTKFRKLFTCSPAALKVPNASRALSSSTLDALKEFYADRDARLKQFEDLKTVAEENAERGVPLTMDVFAEDWNESQFWVCLSSVEQTWLNVDREVVF
jgi:hypothetical protein